MIERSACDLLADLANGNISSEALTDACLEAIALLARHVQWTSSATHAVLPLLGSDAGVRLQVRSGVVAHPSQQGKSAAAFPP